MSDPELIYLNVSVTDKDGNPVPTDCRQVRIKVEGAGRFKAIANGDPTCLEAFHLPQMHLFNGQLTVIVAKDSSCSPDSPITVTVTAPGLRKATAVITD